MVRSAWLAVMLAGCGSLATASDGGTSNNLSFVGSAVGEDSVTRSAPLGTALGGTQRIRVSMGTDGGTPMFGAQTSGAVLGIASVDPPDVVVQGLAEGSATLRILDPAASSVVFGSLALAVAKVDHVDLKPKNYLNPAAHMAFATTAGSWVLFAGSKESCVVRLFDAQGNRLVDERLVMSVPGTTLSAGAQASWDTLPVTAVATSGSGPVAIRTSDGVNRDGMIRIVSAVDDITPVAAMGSASDPTSPQRSGSPVTYCFQATNGSDLVAGVAFTFTVVSSVTISHPAPTNCVTLTAQAPTSTTLTVKAGTVQRDFALSFTAQ